MAGNNEEQMETQVEQVSSDPWAMAFEALNKEDEVDDNESPDTDTGGSDETGSEMGDTQADDQGEGSAEAEGDDGNEPAGEPGGPGDLGGTDGGSDGDLDWLGVDFSEEQVEEYRNSVVEDIKQRTITDVTNAYIKQGARNVNGRLGATINDPDICKRDSDGVPRFYNPETGREFTGDNPRKAAQEWVDYYNRELADAFNKTCQDYSQKLLQEENGRLAIIEFAPKYKKLDPVRRSMFESIIEDYEVTDDDGNIIAYTCDLDKVMNAVNRQVKVIQQKYSKSMGSPTKKPSGPVLDTPSTDGGKQGNGRPQFKSLAEAMEWEQDQLLAKKKGSR